MGWGLVGDGGGGEQVRVGVDGDGALVGGSGGAEFDHLV